jgi:hypothetical protein
MIWKLFLSKFAFSFIFTRPPVITNKQIMSHYFGFGALQLESVRSPGGKLTG